MFYTLHFEGFLLVAVEATVTVLIGLLLDVDHPVFEPALEPQCKPLPRAAQTYKGSTGQKQGKERGGLQQVPASV